MEPGTTTTTELQAIFEGIDVKKRGKNREDKAGFAISRRMRRLTPTPTPETISERFKAFCEANNLDFDECIWAAFGYLGTSSECLDAIDRAMNDPYRPELPEGIPNTESAFLIAVLCVYLAELSENGEFYLCVKIAAAVTGKTERHCRRVLKELADTGFNEKRANPIWNPSDPTQNRSTIYYCRYAEKEGHVPYTHIPRSHQPPKSDPVPETTNAQEQELGGGVATLPGIPQPQTTGNLGTAEEMIGMAVTETKPGPLGIIPLQETMPEPPSPNRKCALKERTETPPPTIVQPSSKRTGKTEKAIMDPGRWFTKETMDVVNARTPEEEAEREREYQQNVKGWKADKPKTKRDRLKAACLKAKQASDAVGESRAERTTRQAAIYAKFLGDTKPAAVKRVVEQIDQHGIEAVFDTVGDILTDTGVKNPVGNLGWRLKNNAAELAV